MTNPTIHTAINDYMLGQDTREKIALKVTSYDTQIAVEAEDGRQFVIEFTGGKLRVLAYEGAEGKETPVILTVPPEGQGDIAVDMTDYNAEPRMEEEPGPSI